MYVNESPVRQTPAEEVAYSITTTPWGSSPSAVAITVYDVSAPGAGSDVTSTTASGSNSVTGDVITTKLIGSLTLGHDYRADVQFTDANNNTHVASIKILCRVG